MGRVKKGAFGCNFSPSLLFLKLITMSQSSKSTQNSTPEEFELSQDQELWDLLGKTPSPEASPLFSRNVMREIRVQESDLARKPSFWQALVSPRHLIPIAVAGMAAVAFLLWNPDSKPAASVVQLPDNEAIPLEVASSLESSFESELLLAAADTPELFSDEEVIAMLF